MSLSRTIAWSTALHELQSPSRAKADDLSLRKARQCIESLVRGSSTELVKADGTFNKERIARLASAVARHHRTLEPYKTWAALMGSSLQRIWSEARTARGATRPTPKPLSPARGPVLIDHKATRKLPSPGQPDTPNPLSPKAVMSEAWRIFRETYNYPYVSFRSIGRRCFASALRLAWARARELVRLASLGSEALESELHRLRGERALLDYSSGRWVDEARAGIRQQEQRIRAALALAPPTVS
jgi:hypothetical protein